MASLHVQMHIKPFAAARQPRRGTVSPAAALYGDSGSNYGGGGQRYGGGSDPRLIIPGQDSNQRPGGRLVVPGQGGGSAPGRGAPGGGGSLLDGMPPMQQQFRPPPGFMNADGPASGPEVSMSVEEMLNRLRSQAGHWHELAKYLPALHRAGYDSIAVEEATGLERRTQNVWNTAAQVYESIKASGQLSAAELAHFDAEGEDLLHELRFLSVRQRTPVAAYVVRYNLRWACMAVHKLCSAHT
jgi:hypothetical protein